MVGKAPVHEIMDHIKSESLRLQGIQRGNFESHECSIIKAILNNRTVDGAKKLVTGFLMLKDKNLKKKGFPIDDLQRAIDDKRITQTSKGSDSGGDSDGDSESPVISKSIRRTKVLKEKDRLKRLKIIRSQS